MGLTILDTYQWVPGFRIKVFEAGAGNATSARLGLISYSFGDAALVWLLDEVTNGWLPPQHPFGLGTH